jgi:chromodomain-helicase-DNA-binding protein 7
MPVEPVSEDRARRVLERVNLLCKIRQEILCHPHLDERLTLCQPSADVPEWWIPGKHDKDLLLGAAKYDVLFIEVYKT